MSASSAVRFCATAWASESTMPRAASASGLPSTPALSHSVSATVDGVVVELAERGHVADVASTALLDLEAADADVRQRRERAVWSPRSAARRRSRTSRIDLVGSARRGR